MATLTHTTNPDRFHNMPAAMLADLIGDLDCQSKSIEAELKVAKDALKGRGGDKIEGSRFLVSFSTSIRQTLDSAAVKTVMGQQWFDDHSKLSEVTICRISINKAALALVA